MCTYIPILQGIDQTFEDLHKNTVNDLHLHIAMQMFLDENFCDHTLGTE